MKKPLLSRFVEWMKRKCKVQTYIIEYVVVSVVLITTAVISKKGFVEWIGVAAVFLTFGHASIAERLREREELRHLKRSPVEVHCYWKLPYYFYAKELFSSSFIRLGENIIVNGIRLKNNYKHLSIAFQDVTMVLLHQVIADHRKVVGGKSEHLPCVALAKQGRLVAGNARLGNPRGASRDA